MISSKLGSVDSSWSDSIDSTNAWGSSSEPKSSSIGDSSNSNSSVDGLFTSAIPSSSIVCIESGSDNSSISSSISTEVS